MGIWIYLRHYINLRILYAVLTTFRTIGPFELNWETQQYKCWISQYITFALLACLQSINLLWLWFIIRIALTVVFKEPVRDVRSDDEDDEEEEAAPDEKVQLVEGMERIEGGKEEVVRDGKEGMNGHTKRRVKAPNGSTLKGTAPDEASIAQAAVGEEGSKER